MASRPLRLSYIGGPTALLELGAARLLTDPTFDPAAGEYQSGPVTLRKLAGSALSLPSTARVVISLTTGGGAGRTGREERRAKPVRDHRSPNASRDYPAGEVATPARHGPGGLNRGGGEPGFVVFLVEAPDQAIYFFR